MVKGKVGIIIILYPWQVVVVIAQLIGIALEKRGRGRRRPSFPLLPLYTPPKT